MNKLKTTKFLLVFTAILFVVKPFLGYGVVAQLAQLKHTDNIIVKIFSKRKPEFLADANDKKMAVAQQLGSFPVKLKVCIQNLLSVLFPLLVLPFRSVNRALQQLTFKLLPDERTYLLTGKLTI